jgi:hypothetical protein
VDKVGSNDPWFSLQYMNSGLRGTLQKFYMWWATTKICRGLSKFTVWRVVGGRDFGATVPLQTGNEPIGESHGLALRACLMWATGLGPWPAIPSVCIRVQCRRGEDTGQRLPMVKAWILYILSSFCPFWERFSSYNSYGRESRASRDLLRGLKEDEAVTAQGDITVGTTSSRAI